MWGSGWAFFPKSEKGKALSPFRHTSRPEDPPRESEPTTKSGFRTILGEHRIVAFEVCDSSRYTECRGGAKRNGDNPINCKW